MSIDQLVAACLGMRTGGAAPTGPLDRYDVAPGGYFTLDEWGKMIDVNQALEDDDTCECKESRQYP